MTNIAAVTIAAASLLTLAAMLAKAIIEERRHH